MRVQKRNGELQALDLHKIHAVLEWACNGDEKLSKIKGVSVSDIELNAKLHLHDKIKTSDIHKLLITSAANLISEDYPNYDQVAARLVWFAVRKEAFGENQPWHLREVIARNVKAGFYDGEFLDYYTEDEIDQLNAMIDHSRDDLFKYAGAVQMRGKYLAQNRKVKKPYESFQFPYIMVAATLFSRYAASSRMELVKDYYDFISQHDISEPTPVMAGVRTKMRQYSSCTVISSGDELDSIERAGVAIQRYASKKAGIGVDGGRIRGEGQPIRGGEAVSTGQIPFGKKFNGDLKSTSQGSVRGASATYNYPCWHLETMSLLELKNEKGTEETRIRTMDYNIHFHQVFLERWRDKKNWTLFSPEEVPQLWDAFYSPDIDKFRTLYEAAERNSSLTKIVVSALKIITTFFGERFETTRYYSMFADTVNLQTPFLEPVTSSNLCQEISLVTRPLSAAHPLGIASIIMSGKLFKGVEGDETVLLENGKKEQLAFIEMGTKIRRPFSDGYETLDSLTYTKQPGAVALCTLAAYNLGKIDLSTEAGRSKAIRMCELTVRAKDALLDYQDYPMPEARLSTLEYRPLGIGIIGLAHWMAKNRLRWGAENTSYELNRVMEFLAFYTIKASIQLAKEFGPCRKRTKYHDGWMPWDSSPVSYEKTLPWDELRVEARIYGIRNGCLFAGMPSETSSQLANETNGFEPPLAPVTVKDSKDGTPPQVVPEIHKLGMYYEYRWDVQVADYLTTMAVVQHYYDQALSLNTSYAIRKLVNKETGQLAVSVLAKDFLLARKLGHKNLYYLNVDDREVADDACEDGACKI